MFFSNVTDQIIKFFGSIIFKPKLEIPEIHNAEDYQKVIISIIKWINELFPSPRSNWELLKAVKNIHSEIFIFQQKFSSNIPERLFVKRFIIQQDVKGKFDYESLDREYSALVLLGNLDNSNGVFTPAIYGKNYELCSILMSYCEGRSFFNVLFQSPIKLFINKYNFPQYTTSLKNLGRWLKEFHDLETNIKTSQNDIRVKLDNDLLDIITRVQKLGIAAKSDFTPELCKKIISTASDLTKQIVMQRKILKNVHGDLTLANILYDSGTLYLLDYGFWGAGFPEDDLARLYLDLRNIGCYSMLLKSSKKRTLSSAFFSGYGIKQGCPDLEDATSRFYLIRHTIINIYMYSFIAGNKRFLNPFICRLFYCFQKNFLLSII